MIKYLYLPNDTTELHCKMLCVRTRLKCCKFLAKSQTLQGNTALKPAAQVVQRLLHKHTAPLHRHDEALHKFPEVINSLPLRVATRDLQITWKLGCQRAFQFFPVANVMWLEVLAKVESVW